MANTAYALMVRDLSSGIDRSRMDDALAGIITLEPEPEFAIPSPPESISPLSSMMPKTMDMEKLREEWGRSPSAIREKLKFDQMLGQLPPQRPTR